MTGAAESMATAGFRVLATAVGFVEADGLDERRLEGTLVLTGLHALLDPPREAATAAVASCHRAGIEVKMITGDHAGTAAAVARQVGVLVEERDGAVLTGAELAELADDDYAAAVDRTSVFARVSPEQKLRLVEALQARGHVVAMTGDGVNDAPALRQADIGVAMGRGGTEVAKDAADMVLTDDDFATIEGAVEEGRGVFDNLTKFIVWTLPTNMGEGFVILVAIMLGTALPILPVQILWINMTTAVALGLMLAFEPKEPGLMSRPPRDPARPLLTGAVVARILLVSALLVGGSWWLFEWERSSGASLAEARTVAMNVFVAVETFYLFSCRSLDAVGVAAGPLQQPLGPRRRRGAGGRSGRDHVLVGDERPVPDRADPGRFVAAHPRGVPARLARRRGRQEAAPTRPVTVGLSRHDRPGRAPPALGRRRSHRCAGGRTAWRGLLGPRPSRRRRPAARPRPPG